MSRKRVTTDAADRPKSRIRIEELIVCRWQFYWLPCEAEKEYQMGWKMLILLIKVGTYKRQVMLCIKESQPTNLVVFSDEWHTSIYCLQINELCLTLLIQNFSKVFLIVNLTLNYFCWSPWTRVLTSLLCHTAYFGRVGWWQTRQSSHSFDEQWLSMLF